MRNLFRSKMVRAPNGPKCNAARTCWTRCPVVPSGVGCALQAASNRQRTAWRNASCPAIAEQHLSLRCMVWDDKAIVGMENLPLVKPASKHATSQTPCRSYDLIGVVGSKSPFGPLETFSFPVATATRSDEGFNSSIRVPQHQNWPFAALFRGQFLSSWSQLSQGTRIQLYGDHRPYPRGRRRPPAARIGASPGPTSPGPTSNCFSPGRKGPSEWTTALGSVL